MRKLMLVAALGVVGLMSANTQNVGKNEINDVAMPLYETEYTFISTCGQVEKFYAGGTLTADEIWDVCEEINNRLCSEDFDDLEYDL